MVRMTSSSESLWYGHPISPMAIRHALIALTAPMSSVNTLRIAVPPGHQRTWRGSNCAGQNAREGPAVCHQPKEIFRHRRMLQFVKIVLKFSIIQRFVCIFIDAFNPQVYGLVRVGLT